MATVKKTKQLTTQLISDSVIRSNLDLLFESVSDLRELINKSRCKFGADVTTGFVGVTNREVTHVDFDVIAGKPVFVYLSPISDNSLALLPSSFGMSSDYSYVHCHLILEGMSVENKMSVVSGSTDKAPIPGADRFGITLPPSSIFFADIPDSSGAISYKLRLQITDADTTVSFIKVRLTVFQPL